MKVQLIRNATMKLTYAGKTILTDPMFSPKDYFDGFASIVRNPTVELPSQVEEIMEGVDSIVVSHLHPDHFDKVAALAISKDLLVFCQPEDEVKIAEGEFQNILPIEISHVWKGITITRTGGQHGTGKILERMGKVSGFIFQADGEPTVYWVGDSIWCEEVENTIKTFSPDIIITHSGGATLPGFDPIIMDGEQTIAVVNAVSEAKVVAIHMESLDHCTVTRKALREMADRASISSSMLLIPEDGETIIF